MPVRKISKRGGPPRQAEDSLNVEKFFIFVDYLARGDWSEPARDGQRPVKRQKVDADGHASAGSSAHGTTEYIPVARRAFAVSRSAKLCESDSPVPRMPRTAAGRAFSFRYSAVDNGLFIAPRFKGMPVKELFLPSKDLGVRSEADDIVLSLLSAAGAPGRRPSDGQFWTSVDLGVERGGGDDGGADGGDEITLTVFVELRWNTSSYVDGSMHKTRQAELRGRVLRAFFPEAVDKDDGAAAAALKTSLSPQEFYEAAHVPSKEASAQVVSGLPVPGLTAELFPFQRRAVAWLLQREGVRWTDAEGIVPYKEEGSAAAEEDVNMSHFVAVQDADGKPCYISSLFGVVTRDVGVFAAPEAAVRGGILCEEMGLGKTVELISLILLHRRLMSPMVGKEESGPSGPSELRVTGATLIVTPPALRSQWLAELERHAPELNVMVYDGVRDTGTNESAEAEAGMVDNLAMFDVVVTTYTELTAELAYAEEPPARAMREARRYHRARSPLMQLSWWRVCLDEAQEVESGVSKAAALVRVLPRLNAWGVTGTPMRRDIQDLWGLLLFLRYPPYATVPAVWRRLTAKRPSPNPDPNANSRSSPGPLPDPRPGSTAAAFRQLFGRIALRHTKRTVGAELQLPPQRRYVITMPFTAVEEQHYQTLFQRLAEACGLDVTGAPLQADWDATDSGVLEAMRTALRRLRQTALHPEIGQHNQRALGLGGAAGRRGRRRGGRRLGGGGGGGPGGLLARAAEPLRTVAEVLEAMIKQSDHELQAERRGLLTQRLMCGQLLENSPRVREALVIWEGVLADSERYVVEARAKLQEEIEAAEAEKATAAATAAAAAAAANLNSDSDDDSEDEADIDDSEFGADLDRRKAGGRVGYAQRQLRYILEILHQAEFYRANAFFQIKTDAALTVPDSEEFRELERRENEGYERAKLVRREILQETRGRALRLMGELAATAEAQKFAEVPDFDLAGDRSGGGGGGGIESRRLGEELQELAGAFNAQATQMDEWREAMIQLLLRDLVDDDEELKEASKHTKESNEPSDKEEEAKNTGNEYEDSTRVQDEILAYLGVLKLVLSDRNTALTSQAPSGLILHEENVAIRLARGGEGPAPELMLRLLSERAALRPDRRGAGGSGGAGGAGSSGGVGTRSLRSVLVELRDISARLRAQVRAGGPGAGRAALELPGIEQLLNQAQQQQTAQLRAVAAVERELERARRALNARIAFYRQLQAVSDTVAPYNGPVNDIMERAAARGEAKQTAVVAAAEAKHRYLLHLKQDDGEDSRLCVICQTSFVVGVLTVCGHRFCKDCITAWFAAHRNCPVCKRRLEVAHLHDIVLKPQGLRVVSDTAAGGEAGGESGEGSAGEGAAGGEPGSGGERGEKGASVNGAAASGIYARLNTAQLAEIARIDLPGPSFTTKVDTLVRHLLWLRVSDPGAKTLVFSQFPEFLAILGHAFAAHQIGFSRYADAGGIERFRRDPGVECFLLHARAHSSGLNLVHASHVVLCEPLLNTALELQAIARVHRIGQQRETTVWLYLVDGTVEESIYNLSVQRRLSHMAPGPEARPEALPESRPESVQPASPKGSLDLEEANSLELQQAQLSGLMAKGSMAGEEVAQDDLWMCLFGHTLRQQPSQQPGSSR